MYPVRFAVCAVYLLLLCSAMDAAWSAEAAGPPSGLAKRVPWTTSKFRGRPEPPPPFKVVPLFPQLRFEQTTLLSTAPGTQRMFVGERKGKIYSIPRDAATADLFVDCNELANRLGEREKVSVRFDSLYGLAFDPQFEENRYCYVCYVVNRQEKGRSRDPAGTRVTRLRVSKTDPPRCDPESETTVITWLAGGHNGGCLKFGPDGYLYVSTGDGGEAFPPDGLKTGQDLTDLLSSILRIDVHPKSGDAPYVIPADNPFLSMSDLRPENWAYGVRNPWKMSFDRKTGELWVGDVGWELWELVFRVRKGENFGWSIVEGRQPVHAEHTLGPTPIVPPTIEIPHTEGASVTGGFVYRGKQFPELDGHYIFGDWETRRVWSVNVDGETLGPYRELIEPTVRIVDFAEDAQGEIYLLDHDDGSIFALARNDVKQSLESFPRRLSETGLFHSVSEHRVAPGVLEFSINAEQWADHAQAQRFLAVPGEGAIVVHPKPERVEGSQFSRSVDFPPDTVLVKTLSLELVHGDPASRRRIETQTLHYDGREWRGYTYEWTDDQTDAVLVESAGKSRVWQIADQKAPGGQRTQTWMFASRNECIRCHNPWSEYTLAFNLAQINRDHDYGDTRANQIETLRHIGVLTDAVLPADPHDSFARPQTPRPIEILPRLTDPYDASADLNQRARSYLHVNCAYCHRFNGGGSAHIYLQHELALKDIKALGLRPTQGTFGIHDAQILAPGEPFRSVLYFRLAKTGPGHMPHIGSKMIDERGLSLVGNWIRSLPARVEDHTRLEQLVALDEATAVLREEHDAARARRDLASRLAQQNKRTQPNEEDYRAAHKQLQDQAASRVKQRATQRAAAIKELLNTPAQSLLLVQAVREGRLGESNRQLVIEASLALTDPATRDLFEAFLPEAQRTKRLGEAVRSSEILALSGDGARGRQLFHESTVVQCRNCHRIAGKGIDLGPDLSQIGKKYDRAKLLDSILDPSAQVEPKYIAWLVETKAGLVLTGLLVSKDDAGIVLKDAQNKLHKLATDDIEGMFPQRKSLMPDLLLRDFTPEQVADLLSYLASLKDNEAISQKGAQ